MQPSSDGPALASQVGAIREAMRAIAYHSIFDASHWAFDRVVVARSLKYLRVRYSPHTEVMLNIAVVITVMPMIPGRK